MSVREIVLWSFLSSTRVLLSTPTTSAASCAGQLPASHCVIGATADRPLFTACQTASIVSPAPHTAPNPVITIRVSGCFIGWRGSPDAEKRYNCSSRQILESLREQRGWASGGNGRARY